MSDSMNPEPQMVPEAKPVETPFADSIQLTGDTAKDLAAIAKEQGLEGVTDVNASGEIVQQAPTQPVQQQPQAVEQPAQAIQTAPQEVPQQTKVPDKFLTPDGKVDVPKLQKSEENVDAMIARYRAKEREAQQLQNRVNNPQPQQAIPMQQVQQQSMHPQMLTPLEIQMAQDLIMESRSFGQEMPQAQAIALARVQARALSARYEADNQRSSELSRRLEESERSRELQGLIEKDPELLSPGMEDKLWQIRQDKPWLNNSPTPWTEAYYVYRGMNPKGHAGQVSTPTPMRPTVPQVPVGPVTRVQPKADVSNPASLSNEQLIAEIRKIHPGFRG